LFTPHPRLDTLKILGRQEESLSSPFPKRTVLPFSFQQVHSAGLPLLYLSALPSPSIESLPFPFWYPKQARAFFKQLPILLSSGRVNFYLVSLLFPWSFPPLLSASNPTYPKLFEMYDRALSPCGKFVHFVVGTLFSFLLASFWEEVEVDFPSKGVD